MLQHLKYFIVCFFVISLVLIGRPASAQIYYSEVAFKDSLVQVLSQYGREVYLRGVDPQEAAFVFERILTIDCHNEGAQDFLVKIHNKYPNVAIRISGCSQSGSAVNILKNDTSDSLEDHPPTDPNEFSAITDSPTQLPPENLVTVTQIRSANRATPIMAYSEPALKDIHIPDVADAVPSSIMDSQKIQNEQLQVTTGELPKNYASGLSADCDQLRALNKKLESEIAGLKAQIKTKDGAIINFQEQIATYQGRDGASYAAIVQDQKDLIRIQQGNIDYLQYELAQAKEQMVAGTFKTGPTYDGMHREIASSQLMAKEKEIDLEAKNREAQLLQKQLGELQEQLRLVKRLLSEKNDIIKSLQDEIGLIKTDNNQ